MSTSLILLKPTSAVIRGKLNCQAVAPIIASGVLMAYRCLSATALSLIASVCWILFATDNTCFSLLIPFE